jgi:4-hydroxy-2-oxoheptanedioate aldolase
VPPLVQVDAIAKVDGIDVLLVGPYDLGNNLHHPITTGEPDEELKAAIEKIRKAAVAAGKKSGIYCISGDQARRYADQDFHMVCLLGPVTRCLAQLMALRYPLLQIWLPYQHSWRNLL